MADERQLRFLIAAGGTVGHVAPALAVAEALRRRGGLVTFAGSPDRVEARLVPERGYEFDAFAVSGLPRRPSRRAAPRRGKGARRAGRLPQHPPSAQARRGARRRRLRRRADGAGRTRRGDPVRAHRGRRASRPGEPARRAARGARLPRAARRPGRREVPRGRPPDPCGLAAVAREEARARLGLSPGRAGRARLRRLARRAAPQRPRRSTPGPRAARQSSTSAASATTPSCAAARRVPTTSSSRSWTR